MPPWGRRKNNFARGYALMRGRKKDSQIFRKGLCPRGRRKNRFRKRLCPQTEEENLEVRAVPPKFEGGEPKRSGKGYPPEEKEKRNHEYFARGYAPRGRKN